jgi:streptogramin lyase
MAQRQENGRRPAAGLKVEVLEGRLLLSGTNYLYVASFATNSVERYQELRWSPAPATGQTGATFAKAGVGGQGNDLHFPLGLLVEPQHPNRLLVSSLLTDEVLEYNLKTGAFVKAFVSAGSGGVSGPAGLLYGPDGDLYLASVDNNEVLRYDGRTGTFIDVYAQLDTMGGITGMVFGPDGALYACTRFSNSVVRITDGGATIQTFVQPGDGGLSRAGGIVFGPDGNVYVTSEDNDSVLRYNGQTGAFMDSFVASGSGGLFRPAGLLFGPFGDLYVCSANSNQVLHYDGHTGAFLNVIVSQHDDQVLSGPRGLLFTQTDPTTLAYHGQPSDDQGRPTVGAFSISLAADISGTLTGTVCVGNPAPVLSDLPSFENTQAVETTGTPPGFAVSLSHAVLAGPDNLDGPAGLESALHQTFLASRTD